MRKVIWSIAALLYAGLVAISYILKIDLLLFFLTVPWSGIVTIFGMLLIHMFPYDLNEYSLVGAAINFVIIARAAIKNTVVNKHLE
jgi:hypothetical protein